MPKEEILIEHKTDDYAINLALDTLKLKKQAIVFANTKRSAEKAAEDIAKHVKISTNELAKLAIEVKKALANPTKQCERLSRCIEKGIAFHHAGLTHKQKELIENKFKEGVIKIICSTPTLAMGLDLPAFRALMKDLRRYGHRGLNWIPTLEYLKMAGRAGRPNFATYGEAIAVATTNEAKKEITER